MHNKIDKQNLRQVILDSPKQFRVGLKAAEHIKLQTKNYKLKTVIVCGMGGSALPGEMLKLFNANYLNAPIAIHIHRNYGLPHYVKNLKPLIVCISYSGNTEESLSAYLEAVKKKLPVVSIASGGKLAELSKKYKTPIAIVPSGVEPRVAVGYQFSALIKILENGKLIKNIDKNLLGLERALKPALFEKQGKALAEKLAGKIPVIYSSQKNKALTYFWKIKFNENAKTLALTNYFPELNHNEMNGFVLRQGQFHVLMLQDANDHPRIQKRMKLTADILKSLSVGVDLIQISGKNIFEKIFFNYTVGEWASYYLAMKYGIDPTPVELVEKLKKSLR